MGLGRFVTYEDDAAPASRRAVSDAYPLPVNVKEAVISSDESGDFVPFALQASALTVTTTVDVATPQNLTLTDLERGLILALDIAGTGTLNVMMEGSLDNGTTWFRFATADGSDLVIAQGLTGKKMVVIPQYVRAPMLRPAYRAVTNNVTVNTYAICATKMGG